MKDFLLPVNHATVPYDSQKKKKKKRNMEVEMSIIGPPLRTALIVFFPPLCNRSAQLPD